MEISWINTRLEYGETVEHLCGIDTLENYRLENIKTRYNGVVRETKRKD